MRSKTAVCLVALAATVASSATFAQPRHDERNDRRDSRESRQERERDRDRRDRDRDHRERGRDDRRDHAERYYYNARGPEFHRGGRLPPELRARPYVVRDWRAYHLAPPARGYEWVQVGPDFVLAAVGTGVILTVVLAP